MSDTRLNEILVRKGARLQQMLDGDHMLFPGAADFIRDAAAEVPIAIASGALRPEILDIITGAGIGELFTTIVASGDTPQSKPSPAPYALAFEQLRTRTGRDLDPRRCVAIEDSRWGLESARGAGLRCVGVTTSYAAADLAGAELVVAGLGRLTLADLDWLCATNGHA
jgi:HAD superfamily hydrolase (TIGR01509 family)